MTDIHRRIEAEIPRLRRYARALVRDASGADDAVQDCLARALSRLHLWREGTDLRAWLFTILYHEHVSRVRRAIRTGSAIEPSDSEPELTRAPPQDKRLELRDLDRALALLPVEQRAVILLIGLEGMSYDNVAQVLGIPVGTVRSRLSRGRNTLRHLTDTSTGYVRPRREAGPADGVYRLRTANPRGFDGDRPSCWAHSACSSAAT